MRYIIKKHYEATESNEKYKGEVRDYYRGVGDTFLSENEMPSRWLVEECGYKSLAGAKKGLKSAQETAVWESAWGHWNVTAELVEIQ